MTGIEIGRHMKAVRIAQQILCLGGCANLAAITDQEWMDLDWLSRGKKGPKRPVSPATRALVAELLPPDAPDPGPARDEDVPE